MPNPEQSSKQPACRLLRLRDIIGDPKATPPTTALIPVSRSTWLNGVKSGSYPKPIKLGPRVTVWKSDDIQKLLNGELPK